MNGNAAAHIQCIEFVYNQMLVDGIQWDLQAKQNNFALQGYCVERPHREKHRVMVMPIISWMRRFDRDFFCKGGGGGGVGEWS